MSSEAFRSELNGSLVLGDLLEDLYLENSRIEILAMKRDIEISEYRNIETARLRLNQQIIMTNNTVGSASAALRLQNNPSGAASKSEIDTAPPPWTRRNDSGKAGNNSGNSIEAKYKAPSFPPMTIPVSENGSESRVRHRNKPEVPHGPRVAPNHPPAHFDEPLVTSDSPGRVHAAGAEVLQGLKNNPVRAVMHPGASVFASIATFLFRLLRPAKTEA